MPTRPPLPAFTLRCGAGKHAVRLDPLRYWRPAKCPVCQAPVDRWRVGRARQWLRGEAPQSGVRIGKVRVTPAPGLALLSLLFALGVLGAFRLLGDQVWVGTVLLFSGRWVWLVPVAGAAVVVAASAPRWVWAPVLAVLTVLVGVMGFEIGWRRLLPAPAGMQLRVATYNVEGGEHVALRLREFVAAHKPDIIGFQECGGPLAAQLADLLRDYKVDTTAGCVASRYPIEQVAVMPQSQFDVVGGILVTTYLLNTPGGRIAYTNLHLATPRGGLQYLVQGDASRAPVKIADNVELRRIESKQARAWVDSRTEPKLVTGDFNLTPDSRIFVRFWSDLQNAWGAAGTGFGYTRLSGWIRARIDHVLVDDRFHVTNAMVGADYGSDHLPLIADLRLLP